jgi:hypothetical protein
MPKMGRDTFARIRLTGGSGSYILVAVLTTTQRNALTAETGQLIYNSTTGQLESYDGSNWVGVGKVYGDATFLKLAGGTMGGNIAMGANKITGLGVPTSANDAARKTYVDTAIDDDIVTHASDIDAHMRDLFQEMRTGDYVFPMPVSGLANRTLDYANYLFGIPFIVVRPITLDRLTIVVTTGDSGKKARLGIYSPGTNVAPGALLVDGGEVDVGSAATVSATIDQALTTPGIYWLAIVSDGTPELRGFAAGWSPRNRIGVPNNPLAFLAIAHTYGALPDPFGTPTISDWATVGIYPRIKSLD